MPKRKKESCSSACIRLDEDHRYFVSLLSKLLRCDTETAINIAIEKTLLEANETASGIVFFRKKPGSRKYEQYIIKQFLRLDKNKKTFDKTPPA